MPNIEAREDFRQNGASTHMVNCPVCGQKLVDVEKAASGVNVLRIKCRRCKRFITVTYGVFNKE
ncbi:MAG: hypothetical protein LIP02_09580 [Bacteroidales bacterium]|nr:hypothetical protein [Bacteroidales bacterium]